MYNYAGKFLFALLAGMCSGLALADSPAVNAPQPENKSLHEVVMYVMPNCGYCARARQHLTELGVTWTERDIVNSSTAQAEFSRHGGVGTPLIVIGNDKLKGYDVARLDAMLAEHALIAR